jgi:hypothetical protein
MARNRTHPPTNWLEKLIAETSTARTVRQWVTKHAHAGIGRWHGADVSDDIEELDRIAALMELPHTTHPWHAAPAKDRRAWINHVKAKVSDLQALLNDPAAPPSPPIAALLVRDPQIRIPALEDTSLHDLLGNLAGHVEALRHQRTPDARPQTGSPEARRFAKFMACYFVSWFQLEEPPYAVLAALVRIRYPSVKVAGTTVRDWIK